MTSSKNSNNISKKTFLQVHSFLEFDNLVGTSVYNKAAEIKNINEPRYYPQQIIKLIPEITSRKLNDWEISPILYITKGCWLNSCFFRQNFLT